MILIPRAVRVYIATQPVSLRKSFDGLSNEVRQVLARDPLSGHVFAFLNRRRNQVKLLVYTRGGFTILHKRLERGTFTFPKRVTPQAPRRRRGGRDLARPGRGGRGPPARPAHPPDPPRRGGRAPAPPA